MQYREPNQNELRLSIFPGPYEGKSCDCKEKRRLER
jgi:hypothetical protein